MTQAVVLNGWHKGHVCMLPGALPVLRLHRPKVTTWCHCHGSDEDDLDYTNEAQVDEYKIAMRGADGDVCAYSTDGSSKWLLEGRDWITSAERDFRIKRKPLYWNQVLDVDCRDERAWGGNP